MGKGEVMNKAETERDQFENFMFDRGIQSWEEGVFYSLWKISKSLEQIARTLNKKGVNNANT
jgi:hypothetical protein